MKKLLILLLILAWIPALPSKAVVSEEIREQEYLDLVQLVNELAEELNNLKQDLEEGYYCGIRD